ncbi:MAG: hypothetical protein U1E42_09730 [Rhodospirillales bacterium]
MADTNFTIRLGVKDAETVRRSLESLGAQGEKTLARIERAARGPSAGMKALRAASSEVEDGVRGLAARAGPLGSGLEALGGSGLAAAAGLGAITAGFGALMDGARKAIDHFDALADSADRVGVGVEELQKLQFAFAQSGSSTETWKRHSAS